MSGAPLSLPERTEISRALIEDRTVPWELTARRIDRHRTTVSREVNANGGRHGYRPAVAHQRASQCRRRPRTPMLGCPGPLRERVTAELAEGRSPEAISADLVAVSAAQRVCTETIYTAVYTPILDTRARECLSRRRPHRRHHQTPNPNSRPALPNIAARPTVVNNRSEPRRWEADHIGGRANRSALMCLTVRVSRYSIPVTMPNGYSSPDALAGLGEGFERVPGHLRRSVTFDQGSHGCCGRYWPPPTASTSGSATLIRRGSAARSRTSTVSGGGGSRRGSTWSGPPRAAASTRRWPPTRWRSDDDRSGERGQPAAQRRGARTHPPSSLRPLSSPPGLPRRSDARSGREQGSASHCRRPPQVPPQPSRGKRARPLVLSALRAGPGRRSVRGKWRHNGESSRWASFARCP